MQNKPPFTTLFLDIGGVLLSNGWDRTARKLAATTFSLELPELEERHHLTFDTYEEGKLTLDEYLDRIVFYEKRSFTKEDFRDFIFAQTEPFPEMIDMIIALKKAYGLKVVVVNNEGRELNEYRIRTFGLNTFVDFFISSCFVHIRKPDADIFRIALDIALVQPGEVLYIEDRPMFVHVAGQLGITGICHDSYETTREMVKGMGMNW
jgi:putative hydrolase of the HAD superfamily